MLVDQRIKARICMFLRVGAIDGDAGCLGQRGNIVVDGRVSRKERGRSLLSLGDAGRGQSYRVIRPVVLLISGVPGGASFRCPLQACPSSFLTGRGSGKGVAGVL